jgi:hypothetical protein
MTDYSDLVRRLRAAAEADFHGDRSRLLDEAADVLEGAHAQADNRILYVMLGEYADEQASLQRRLVYKEAVLQALERQLTESRAASPPSAQLP